METLQYHFNQSHYLKNEVKKYISAKTGLTEAEVYVSKVLIKKLLKYLSLYCFEINNTIKNRVMFFFIKLNLKYSELVPK